MDDGLEEITIHSFSWKPEIDPNTGYTTIHCWGFDRNSNPHLLRLHDFDAFCYIELPLFLNNSMVRWEGFRERKIFESICFILGDDKPHRYRFEMKQKYYYYKGENKRYPMLLVCFHSIEAMNKCKNMLKRPIKVFGLRGNGRKDDTTMVPLRVWETHIPIERKMLTLRNSKYCQWFKIRGIKVTGEEKISSLENEYVVDWKTLDPIPLEDTVSWLTHPGILSFDLETYSDRHNAMPDSLSAKHVIYLVSIVYQRFLKPETRKKEIILLGDCSDTDLANVIKVKTELELIQKFQELLLKYNPDIITGYNIFAYDNPYLDDRLKRKLRDWGCLGRLLGVQSQMKYISWSSSAYKNQDFHILEMNGRISVDMLAAVKRDHKLPLYNLDYVSKHFLKRGKYDVKAKQMFEAYELQSYLLEPGEEIPLTFIEHCKNSDIKNVEEEWLKTHRTFALDEMKKVVEYCVVDSDLVIDLFDKLNTWIGLVQLSNIMGVVPEDLLTKGTGVRMISQIYDEASREGIVLDEVEFPKINVEGAFVFDPVSGIYRYVPVFDFKSLYPTIMISHNIDHSTMLPPNQMDLVPDEECHVIEWDEEVEEDAEDEDEEEKVVKNKKLVHQKYKFVKNKIGIMPKLLIRLISERNKVRAKQKLVDKNTVEWNVLEQTQLGIKCSSNAFYGACGSSFSKLRLPTAAACITAKARESTKKMNAYLESKGHRIIYGDTDSTMPDVGITDPKQAMEVGHRLAKELSKLYPKPMEVEFECTYDTMLCIKKKMYLCILLNDDGEAIDNPDAWKIRGVTLARRDNCLTQRTFYKEIANQILHFTPFMDVFNYIIDRCIEIVSHSVSWKNFIMIKGLGSNYKSKSFMMNIFSQEMQKNGNPLAAGDRIPYLVVQSKGLEDQKVGYKMRTIDLFTERAESEEPEHIDYLHYLEKTIKNGIEKQLFQVGYKKELKDLQEKYKEIDQNKFFKSLEEKMGTLDKNPELREIRIQGYRETINKLGKQYYGDKEKIITHLLNDETFQKIAKPLYTFHIKRRIGRKRRLSSRVDSEPIMMFVRLARAKEKVMKSIRK